MTSQTHQKVTASHLKRDAYLYVRQSTLRQVFENTESTKRQYALRERAVALGWPLERIHVVDSDLGQSGASAVDREGFQKLVGEVGMGRAGIVLGLEVSRLARNCMDWHRLLEICALTNTLILDEDGIYDPAHFNDRLLLGLKGTMSEAELHVLRARLRGGILSKARRGELVIPPPVGLVYNSEGELALDPDQQVQQSLRLLFETFRRTGSAMATVKAFRRQALLFPRRLRAGPRQGELVWMELRHSQTLRILHNPRYAGAFVFGRSRTQKKVDGGVRLLWLPREEWDTLIPGAHTGYLSWEEYEANQRRLRESAQSQGADRRKSPPREGPALLQGLIVCGICGSRMTVRYHTRGPHRCPDYVCQQQGIERGESICQMIPGAGIDQAVGKLLVAAVTPVALEVALCVQQELQSRLEEADRLRQKQVERARYEADLAQRRYLRVDPDHRLVADSLEADWNHKLRALAGAQQEYERQRQADRGLLTDEERSRILALATDFPRLWRDPKTPDRERKRMVRLLLEDVTLLRGGQITVHVRFKGGVHQSLTLPLPLNAWQQRTTSTEAVAEIDRLLDLHTDRQIASILNAGGYQSGEGQLFSPHIVARIRRRYGLKSRFHRLRGSGMVTLKEMAKLLGITPQWVKIWKDHGLLAAQTYNDKGECLYEHPGENAPRKMQGLAGKLSDRLRLPSKASNRTEEVQCEA
jgi:DNA invertase Pin-like site-specific DNA recombinase